jgi:hypothetical protein
VSGVTLNLTDEQAWMLYDLVASQKERHDAAELETRSNCGGEPWRLLHRKIRAALPDTFVPVAPEEGQQP